MIVVPWETDPASPVNEQNPVPLYGVSWDRLVPVGKRRRTSNAWTDKAKAEAVYVEMLRAGRNPKATVRGIAGFAL